MILCASSFLWIYLYVNPYLCLSVLTYIYFCGLCIRINVYPSRSLPIYIYLKCILLYMYISSLVCTCMYMCISACSCIIYLYRSLCTIIHLKHRQASRWHYIHVTVYSQCCTYPSQCIKSTAYTFAFLNKLLHTSILANKLLVPNHTFTTN